MLNSKIEKIEKADVYAPKLQSGMSAIIFQRHERYERDPSAENAGSVMPEARDSALKRYKDFFNEVFNEDTTSVETMLLFVASDTQYAGRGYRSMETAQIAQDAALNIMEELGIDPQERIINLNPEFNTDNFEATGQSIRPDKGVREPQIFETTDYVNHLKEKYGASNGLTPAAWSAHEADTEKETRELFGAEGVHDMLARTKKSLAVLERYARVFHANNPSKKLIIWVASHYDTISPLVKDATSTSFEDYVPVDYGAGVVIELSKDSGPTLSAQGQKVALKLGKEAATPNR